MTLIHCSLNSPRTAQNSVSICVRIKLIQYICIHQSLHLTHYLLHMSTATDHWTGNAFWSSRELLQAFWHKRKGLIMVFKVCSFLLPDEKNCGNIFGPGSKTAVLLVREGEKFRKMHPCCHCGPEKNTACCTDRCDTGIRHKQAFSIEAASQKASKYARDKPRQTPRRVWDAATPPGKEDP